MKSAIKYFLALTGPNRTSRKRAPKLQSLSGRLREVVIYKNRTTGVSSEKRSGHLYFMEDNFMNASQDMCSSILSLRFFVYAK